MARRRCGGVFYFWPAVDSEKEVERVKRILAVLVENHPGVLTRVAGLIRRRGYNIDSLAVGVTDNPDISRMTLVVDGDEGQLQQVSKQLAKLIEVISVIDLDSANSVARELALVKVKASPQVRPQVLQVASVFRANVVDVSHDAVTIEVTGTHDKVEALISLAREFGLEEVVRTGVIALERGAGSVKFEREEEREYDADVLRV
jgi:acetolactate synthase I/III small subunit